MADKLKCSLRNNKTILLSGGITLLSIIIVYICVSVKPFGENIIFQLDLYNQYGPLFSELCDRIAEGESLIYSWNTGLGGAFIGNFFNYLSSPFTLLILIMGRNNVFESVAIVIALKATLSSISMTYYIKKSLKSEEYITAAFGVLYAFCGFFIAYYWNVMWLDALYLFPLVILGIERIIDSGKCKTYFFALLFAIFSNYYIAYMICIFSCVYFIYYYVCSKSKLEQRQENLNSNGKRRKIRDSFFLQSGIRFALCSFAVAGVLLFVLYAVAYALSPSSATSFKWETLKEFQIFTYFDPYNFIVNHFADVDITFANRRSNVLPNVYCGVITLLFLPLYFMCKKIARREKIASGVLLVFMYLSFNINIFNYIWHGLTSPNGLPFRESFMYSFFIIILAYKAYTNIDSLKKKQILVTSGVLVCFAFVVLIFGSINADVSSVIFTVVSLIIITTIIMLTLNNKIKKQLSVILLSIIMIAESVVCYSLSFSAYNPTPSTKVAYAGTYDDFEALQAQIAQSDDDLFYREEMSDYTARMNGSWHDYNGVSSFSSMTSEAVTIVERDFGLPGNEFNMYSYFPQTPIFNSIFSIKYIYDNTSSIHKCDYYTPVASNSSFTAYQNDYSLSLAYPVSNALINWNSTDYNDNPVVTQEDFFCLATGIEDVYTEYYDYKLTYENTILTSKTETSLSFERVNSGNATATATITAKTDGNYYAYMFSEDLNGVTDSVNNSNYVLDIYDIYIVDFGYHNAGDKISIKMSMRTTVDQADVELLIFSMDDKKFVEGYNTLYDGQMEITEFEETKISGNFTAEENEILFTSIPYDVGWSVYLDGEKVDESEIVKISDAFLGVKVSEGKHNITFEYEIPGLKTAFIFSICFSAILIILYVLNKKKLLFFKNKKQNLWERSE